MKILTAIVGVTGSLAAFAAEMVTLIGVLLALAGYIGKDTLAVTFGIGLALVFAVLAGFEKVAKAIKGQK